MTNNFLANSELRTMHERLGASATLFCLKHFPGELPMHPITINLPLMTSRGGRANAARKLEHLTQAMRDEPRAPQPGDIQIEIVHSPQLLDNLATDLIGPSPAALVNPCRRSARLLRSSQNRAQARAKALRAKRSQRSSKVPKTLKKKLKLPEMPAEPYTCPICMESCFEKEPTSTPCGHVFCNKCIKLALRRAKTCPICMKRTLPQRLFRLYI